MCIFLAACSRSYVQNPDPNHTHADFAVWVEEEEIDLSSPELMSGVSHDEHSHDEADEYHHEYLHLHDGIGGVVHQHKPGLTLDEFFASLGFTVQGDCMTVVGKGRLCRSGAKRWWMFVNGEERAFDLAVPLADMDKILLTYGDLDDLTIAEQIEALTDDACLYSRTCPWRGDPPAENCVADPAVPCTVPLDDL